MDKTLKEYLTIAADALENGLVNYNWHYHSHCNCGVVVQAITGLAEIQIDAKIAILKEKCSKSKDATWTVLGRTYCPITGEPVDLLFKQLKDIGLDIRAIRHLEFLNDPQILEKCSFETLPDHYTKKQNLIEYLRVWISMLPPPLPVDETEISTEKMASIEKEAAILMAQTVS